MVPHTATIPSLHSAIECIFQRQASPFLCIETTEDRRGTAEPDADEGHGALHAKILHSRPAGSRRDASSLCWGLTIRGEGDVQCATATASLAEISAHGCSPSTTHDPTAAKAAKPQTAPKQASPRGHVSACCSWRRTPTPPQSGQLQPLSSTTAARDSRKATPLRVESCPHFFCHG